jgi:hypothetical protein
MFVFVYDVDIVSTNQEFERVQEEAVVATFEVEFEHLIGRD